MLPFSCDEPFLFLVLNFEGETSSSSEVAIIKSTDICDIHLETIVKEKEDTVCKLIVEAKQHREDPAKLKQSYEEKLKNKEEMLQNKEEMLQKNEEILQKNEEILQKNEEILQKNEEMLQKNEEMLQNKEQMLQRNEEMLQKKKKC